MEIKEEKFLQEIVEKSSRGELSKEKVKEMADAYGLPLYKAENIWSFYGHESRKVKVCNGLPCKLSDRYLNSHFVDKYPESEREYASCLGYCDHAPVVKNDGKYYQVRYENLVEIVPSKMHPEREFVNHLSDYINGGGYETLRRVMKEFSGEDVREIAKKLSLHGLGGAGFPTYVKWDAVSRAGNGDRYLVVNAHEGEPGTFKDRVIMETKPYELLESSIIVAHAVGANKVIVALKHEYENAERSLKKALSASISHFKDNPVGGKLPHISIMRIPGYYVTGEESALLEAIEGKRSEPRLRPPYPAEVGLYGKPTLIDNVETLVFFLEMLQNHLSGDESAPDKAYCLTGDVGKPGVYFMPYGSSSSDLLQGMGETPMEGLKAVFPGGLSGGILPSEKAGINLDFDSVRKVQANLGTGAMIAISDRRCMVDVVGNVEKFFESESCGKCIPCRLGTREISGLFSRLKDGEATPAEIERALGTAEVMLKGSICGLGQAAAKMYMDSIRYFRKEIEDHTNGECAAHTCFSGLR